MGRSSSARVAVAVAVAVWPMARARTLHDHLLLLYQAQHGKRDVLLVDDHNLVDPVTGDGERVWAHLRHSQAVGKGGHRRRAHGTATCERCRVGGTARRLDADDADGGVERLHSECDARNETAATDGHDARIRSRHLQAVGAHRGTHALPGAGGACPDSGVRSVSQHATCSIISIPRVPVPAIISGSS